MSESETKNASNWKVIRDTAKPEGEGSREKVTFILDFFAT